MNETALYCVASAGDDILMWSHYGGQHAGVSLRFRPRPLLAAFSIAFPVHYTADRPRIVVGTEDRLEQLQKLLLTKADFWSYECEWRFVEWRGRAGVRTFPSLALDGIILGARISNADEEMVRGWVSERADGPIEILRASLNASLFRIDVA